MKNLYLLLLALLPTSVMAQNKIAYSYDEAGNVINRCIVIMQSRSISQDASSANDIYDDRIAKVTIHPNPTKGILKIDFNDFTESDNIAISIFDISGKKIISQSNIPRNVTFDLTNYANGLYILQIIRNENHSSWKIIKK